MTIHDLETIRGAGGGGKKGGGSGSNAANTLRSKARARMVEVISEGPIVGLLGNSDEDREKCIYFDQTPLRNKDGSVNFDNVVWQESKGNPDGAVFKGQSAVETSVDVNVVVKSVTGPVQRTIVDTNVDAVRVIVRVDSLYIADKETGRLKTNSLTYSIDVRGNAGAWKTVVTNKLENEKNTAPTQFAHRIELPDNGAPWDIRVRKETADSTDDNNQKNMTFEGYVELVEGKFTYPHSAAVAMEVNAEDMGNSIPARSYRVRGLKVKVPSNYDPETRVYTGIWNGTFKVAWTNNPAWIFYDLLINDRYGLGEFINAATVDKWSLYTIAQYCDQAVKSGFKNADTGADIMEPRFSYNGVIKSRDDAFFVLQTLSTAWRGMAYWSLGQVFATADIPADPVKLVSPANVINGEFNYASTAVKARHSVILIKWNDPDDFYRPSTEVVINQAMLERFGWREKTINLNGCTSRGLAHRYGKWVLDIEQNETETLEYAASLDHATVKPGDIIAVADPRKAAVRLGGRVVSHTADRVVLDYDFEAAPGQTYQLMLVMPDGSIEKKNITSWVDARTPKVAGYTRLVDPNASFMITGSDIVPRQYRVLAVEETEETVFKVTALFHDPLKYARIEKDIYFEPLPYDRPSKTSKPPTNLQVKETGYVLNGNHYTRLTVSWTPPVGIVSRQFVVTMDTPYEADVQIGTTSQNSIEIESSGPGSYKFYVRTIDFTGAISRPAVLNFEAEGPGKYALPFVTNLELKDNPGQTEFTGRDVRIRWKNLLPKSTATGATGHEPTDENSPLYKRNVVKIYRVSDNQLLRTETIIGKSYTYDYLSNRADNRATGQTNASRNLRFAVTLEDVFGRTSAPAELSVQNPVPAMFNPTGRVNGRSLYLTWTTPIDDDDIKGVMIWASKTSGFNPYTTSPIFDGVGSYTTFLGDPSSTYYVRAAAYDGFGKIDLNISPEIALTTMMDIDFEAPAIPTGFTLSSSTVGDLIKLVATWNANTETDLAYYDIKIAEGVGNFVSFTTSTNRYEWTVRPNVPFKAAVRAVDNMGNKSGYTAEVTHTSTKDTTPPAVPANFAATGTFKGYWLKGDMNSESDFLLYEVYESTGSTAPNAATAPTYTATSATINRAGLAEGLTLNLWLRAVDTSGNKSAWTAVIPTFTLTIDGSVPPPDVPTGLAATSQLVIVQGNVRSRVRVTWNAVSAAVAYELGLIEAGGSGNERVIITGTNSIEFDGLPGVAYTLRVRSVGAVNNKSAFTATIAHTPTGKVTPPTTPTGFAASAGIDAIWLAWAASVENDIAYYEVYEHTSNASGSATLIGRVTGTTASRTGLALQSTRYYWIKAVDTSGNKSAFSAVASATTGSLPDPKSFSISGVTFTPDVPANRLSWTAGSVAYGIKGAAPTTKTISAGQFDWTSGTAYVYYLEDQTALSVTTSLATAYQTGAFLIGVYKGAKDFQLIEGKALIDGNTILAGTIGANQLVTNTAVITGTAQIADAIITNAKITELSAAKLTAGTALASTITVSGAALSTIKGNAELGAQDPASRINAASTQIDPGKIVISGATSLADWRGTSDTTTINGGKIEAQSIYARSIMLQDMENLQPNGNFEEDNYSAYFNPATAGGTGSFVNGTGQTNTRYLRLTKDSLSAATFNVYAKDFVPVTRGANKQLLIETAFRGNAAAAAGAYMRIAWFDASKNPLSPSYTSILENEAISTSWQTVSVKIDIPTTAYYYRLIVHNGVGNTTALSLDFDRFVVRRANAAELIVDGEIKANHLNTTSAVITGTAQIANAIITDAKITTLSATKLIAGTALAGSITVSGTALSSIKDRATAAAPGVSIRINQTGFTTVDSDECYIHGFNKDGNAADVDGWINYNGEKLTVPKGILYGQDNVAYTAWIVMRVSSAVFVMNGTTTDRRYAACRLRNGQWSYDNNSIWVNFTPNSDYIVIGAVEKDATDVVAATIWAEGAPLGSITDDLANDPAALINLKSTKINPGQIVISGGTTLSDWRSGTDATKIEGGNISADSIQTNSLKIGSRGISVRGFDFEVKNKTTGQIGWSAGYISYVADNGTVTTKTVAAGTATFSTAGYIYWTKDATTLSSTTNIAATQADNVIMMASYNDGVSLQVMLGGTIIDGTRITTGSVTATQLGADSVTAVQLKANAVESVHIKSDAVMAKHMVISDTSNIVPDNGLQDASNWTLNGAVAALQTHATYGQVFRWTTQSTAGSTSNFIAGIWSKKFPVIPGEYLQYGCMVDMDTSVAEQRVQVYIRFYDGAGDTTTYNTMAPANLSANLVQGSVTVPAGSVAANIYMRRGTNTNGATSDGSARVWNPFVYRRMTGTLIVDGAIEASKLTIGKLSEVATDVGTITAGKLQSSDGKMVVDLTGKRILMSD